MKKKLLRFPKVLELDYKKWICGGGLNGNYKKINRAHGNGSSKLLNSNGYMCCLGQFSEQAGISEKCLLNIGMPHHLDDIRITKASEVRFDEAASINDASSNTIAEKVVGIRGVFRRNQIKLKNFPKRIQEQIKKLEKKKK